MLWLIALVIAVIAILPLSNASSAKDIDFYRNGTIVHYKNSDRSYDKYND